MTRKAGISLRVVENHEYQEKYDQISHDWIRWLSFHSIMPVLIPNVYPGVLDFVKSMNISVLLLTGGNNVGPIESRKEDQEISDVSLERDETEKILIDYALKNKIPVLGVCRGMQMLNVYFNGDIERDVESICLKPNSHVCDQHEIRIIHNGIREALDSDRVYTNSYHNQGVLLNGLGQGLKPFAVADGNIMEGFYHTSQHVLGIQWHPERKYSNSALDQVVLKAWLGFSNYRSLFWE